MKKKSGWELLSADEPPVICLPDRSNEPLEKTRVKKASKIWRAAHRRYEATLTELIDAYVDDAIKHFKFDEEDDENVDPIMGAFAAILAANAAEMVIATGRSREQFIFLCRESFNKAEELMDAAMEEDENESVRTA